MPGFTRRGTVASATDMLTTLRIKNLALVSDLTLELAAGCNVITGETGAGKSIIIGALNLVLGQRADRTLIRTGADGCTVEAVFSTSQLRAPLAAFLEENGLEPCDDRQLVLKRTFTNAGTNRQFVNGSPTSLQTLATLGEWLVDMHGPHDHQSLLHPAKQLAILDAYGNLHPLRHAFAELVGQRAHMEEAKRALITDEITYQRQLDLLRHQVAEIRSARLQLGEEEEVEQEHSRVSNAARLIELARAASNLLAEDEASLQTQAGALGRILAELQKIDPGASSLNSLHGQAAAALGELQGELSTYADKLDLDPARLQELEERLDLIHSLKRKYGSSLEAVIAFGEEAALQLARLEQRESELARLDAELARLDSGLKDKGRELTAARKKLIPKLTKAALKQLADLGFNQCQFDIALSTEAAPSDRLPGRVNLTGFDAVEFQFSPNFGEPLRPLRAIASSGEMARVMLALKTVLAAEDEIPVLVFDEVDANVGGETAHAVGEKMRQIARQRQVLCITHLPQVAAAATAHYQVSKEVRDGRTLSEIKLLSQRDRVAEIARMLGGQSAAARKHAEALLGKD